MADLSLVIGAHDSASAVLSEIGTRVLELGKACVESFENQEKADRKLSAALRNLAYDDVPGLTASLKSQASQFQETLGVQDEMVEGMQGLMISFGVLPKDIEKTTQAVLDYTALMGGDAVSNTEKFLRTADMGAKGFGRMGIAIEDTGTKSGNLAAAIEEVSRKMGGQAAADAESYAGQMKKVTLQFEDLEKSFGKIIVTMAEKTGVIEKVTTALKFWNEAITGKGPEDQERSKALNAATEKKIELVGKLQVAEATRMAALDPDGSVAKAATATIAGLNVQLAEAEAAIKRINKERGQGGSPDGTPGKAQDDRTEAAKKAAEAARKALEKIEEDKRKAYQNEEKKHDQEKIKDNMLAALGLDDDTLKEAEQNAKLLKEIEAAVDGDAKAQAKKEEAMADGIRRVREEGFEKDDALAKKAAAASRKAGEAIGMAFINALEGQFTKMKSGGSFDLGEIIKQMLPTLIGFALAATPLAPFAPIISGAASLLLSTFHSGGYVDGMPRYHTGGLMEDEVPAILQRGEYVVNRGDVAANGGPGGVKQALRAGGSGGNTYITAMDAISFRDYVSNRGGSAMVKSVNSGTGEFAQMIRKAKR